MSFFHGNEKNPKSGNCISNIPFLLSTNQLRKIPSNPFIAQLCCVNLVKNKMLQCPLESSGQTWPCQEHWHTPFHDSHISWPAKSLYVAPVSFEIFLWKGKSESNMTARKTLVINIFNPLECQLLLRIQSQEYSRGMLNMETPTLVVLWAFIVFKEREKDVVEIVLCQLNPYFCSFWCFQW
jgi:hypothetical protein